MKSKMKVMKLRWDKLLLRNFPTDSIGIKKKSVNGLKTASPSGSWYCFAVWRILYAKKVTTDTKNMKSNLLIALNPNMLSRAFINPKVMKNVME
jgi:hypothetical protein